MRYKGKANGLPQLKHRDHYKCDYDKNNRNYTDSFIKLCQF